MLDNQLAIGFAVFVGFVFCIVVHECAHALVASWLGDDTARLQGRLTLNPIPHIDPILSILLPVSLWLSGAPIFGGAKGVPVDMNNLRGNRLTSMMWVALAGPVSNVLLAVVFALLLNLVPWLLDWDREVATRILVVLLQLVITNVVLALFNLIPVPPLDGSRILAACLPGRSGWFIYEMERFGMIFVAILVFSGGTRLLLSQPVLTATAYLIQGTAFGDWGEIASHWARILRNARVN